MYSTPLISAKYGNHATYTLVTTREITVATFDLLEQQTYCWRFAWDDLDIPQNY